MESELRPTLPDLFRVEFLPCDSGLGQHAAQTLQIRVVPVAQPEHTGLVKNFSARARGELTPERQGAYGPARIEFVRAISHAYNAGFAARAGTAVGWAV